MLTGLPRGHVASADSGRRHLLRAAVATPWLAATALPVVRARGDDEPLSFIDDLRPLLAAVARDRRPLLLFFSTPGCPFCRAVRRSYLHPRVQDGAAASGVVIREIIVAGNRPLRDRDGGSLTESAFAARYGVRMVPHLELVDARGERLVSPLIGFDRASFYESFLQSAIGEATARLRR